jgi:hypothetical protein
MTYGTTVSRLALGCALLVPLLASSAVAGGPPWISVELPGDPTNPASRGAVVLIHAYSCGGPTPSPVTATAEGMVNGERRTVPLTLKPAGATGVYAVTKQWPSEGAWVLTFTMSVGGEVSTLVTLGPDGGADSADASGMKSAADVHGASVQVVRRKVTAAEVDSVLRAAATGGHQALADARPARPTGLLVGGVGAAALVVGSAAGIAVVRRRRH